MANFKRHRRRGRHSDWLRNPHKDCCAPAFWRYRTGELRRLGGRGKRIRRKDVGWAYRDET